LVEVLAKATGSGSAPVVTLGVNDARGPEGAEAIAWIAAEASIEPLTEFPSPYGGGCGCAVCSIAFTTLKADAEGLYERARPARPAAKGAAAEVPQKSEST
jgi:hypothetical protein